MPEEIAPLKWMVAADEAEGGGWLDAPLLMCVPASDVDRARRACALLPKLLAAALMWLFVSPAVLRVVGNHTTVLGQDGREL